MLLLLPRIHLSGLQQNRLLANLDSQGDHSTNVSTSKTLKGPRASSTCHTRLKDNKATFSGINPNLCSVSTMEETLD